ncbi:MAG TPA: tetratricopeptide repeat protein [Stellaceae bacterium]|nr:tetratricopeptide repeat protein [Stellaceae bacterium]
MALVPLKLQVLGGFRLRRADASEVDSLGRKEQALFAYLALQGGRPQTRDKLASLLWGDRGDQQARHSLRQSLTVLRRALPDPDGDIIVADQETIALSADAIEVDIVVFAHSAQGESDAADFATRLYSGELLDGLSAGSEEFEEWLVVERSRTRDLATAAFTRSAKRRAATGDYDGAIEAARQLLTLDPIDEDGHRLLMRAYYATGRRAAAMRQFKTCSDLLMRQLNAGPSVETVRLYERMRDNTASADIPPVAAGSPSDANEASIAGREAAEPAQAAESAPSKSAPMEISVAPATPRSGKRPLWAGRLLLAAAVLIVAGAWYWFEDIDLIFFRSSRFAQQIDSIFRQRATVGRMAYPLPQKPSIAILPFENLSTDPAQEIFVDAVTEDITVVLAAISDLFVIDRSTALSFKGRSVRVRQVAEELGVRYVLEGSVRRSTERVRVSARLIDALAGQTLWADRFDIEATDIFTVQDEITLRLVTAVRAVLTEGDQELIAFAHGTRNLDAWLAATQGLHLLRQLTRADTARARELYRHAVQADPHYAGAWDGLGWTYVLDFWNGWTPVPGEAMRQARECAKQAVELDPKRGRSYALLGIIALMSGDDHGAIENFERALQYSPGDAEAAALMAYALTYTGDLDRAEAMIRQALRLSPNSPEWYRWTLARIDRLHGRLAGAVEALAPKLPNYPDSIVPRVELLLTYIQIGRSQDARAMADEILRIDPSFSVSTWTRAQPYTDQGMVQREMQALRVAGLPD